MSLFKQKLNYAYCNPCSYIQISFFIELNSSKDVEDKQISNFLLKGCIFENRIETQRSKKSLRQHLQQESHAQVCSTARLEEEIIPFWYMTDDMRIYGVLAISHSKRSKTTYTIIL